MAVLYTNHFVQFFDNNGNPLSNGKLFAYSAGTTTPKATYTTEAATVENSHPIVLDAAGRATVFIEGSYRFDLFDENDVLIESTDDVTSFTTLNEAGDPFFQSFSGDGSQTVFTLSESLGNDSKDIMVFVDAGGNEGYEIQNPSAFTLSGTSLTFNSAPASGTDNIYVFAPTKLLGAAAASAAAAAASAAEAQTNALQGGFNWGYDVSTTEGDPGTGDLRFNNTTLASATELYISHTADGGQDVDAWLGTWDDPTSTNKGTLRIFKQAEPEKFAIYYVTGTETDNTTWSKFNLTYVDGAGSLQDGDVLGVWFILNGDKGDTGAAGTLSATSGVTADSSAGASLISSGSNTCLSWGGGGSANLTLGGNMSGGGSHKLVNMADGTSAQDYVTKAQLDASGGGWVPLQTQTVTTAVSSVDFTSGIDSTYKAYVIIVDNLNVATDGADIWVRTSTNAGVSWDSGSGNYGYAMNEIEISGSVATSNTNGSSSDTKMVLNNGPQGTATGESMSFKIIISDPASTSDYTKIYFQGVYVDNFTELNAFYGSGARLATADVDAIQFLASSGNITAGTFTLYGLAGA